MIDKSFVEAIAGMAKPAVVEVGEETFSTVGELKLVKHRPTPAALRFSTLKSLLDYAIAGADVEADKASLYVRDPWHVVYSGHLLEEWQRHTFAEAVCPRPSFPFGNYMSQEEFIVGLQTQFVDTGERAQLIRIAGNITAEEIQISMDDGVTQQVSARAGLSLQDRVSLPNVLELRPIRTFREIAQPPSPFILRVRQGPKLALFEADGGSWMLTAVEWIAKQLQLPGVTPGVPIGLVEDPNFMQMEAPRVFY